MGIGASQQYRVDEVIISLRLVSINSGEVLLSTAVSKTIYSTSHNIGVFKFFDSGTQSLELENGAALNEPTTYAVRVAIEQGVYEMIVAGEKKGLWRFKNSQSPTPPVSSVDVVQERINEPVKQNGTQKQTADVAPAKDAPTDVRVSKTQTRQATVVEWSNVRVSQDQSSEKLANLLPGSMVEILTEEKMFYRIKVDGKEGWVAKRFIKAHR